MPDRVRRGIRHVLFAVVDIAVVVVEFVRLGETVDDARRAGRTIDVERVRPSGDPALRDGLAEIADVVGVEVRQQDGAEVAGRKPGELHRLPRSRADVDEHELAAREHRSAGASAILVGERRTGPAQHDVQIGRLQDAAIVGRERLLDLPVDHAIAAGEEKD